MRVANSQHLWGLAAACQSLKYGCLLQEATVLAKAKRIQVPNIRLMIKNENRDLLVTLPFPPLSLSIRSDSSIH